MGTLVGYKPSTLVKDFRALKKEIEEEGLFEVRGAGAVDGALEYLFLIRGSMYENICCDCNEKRSALVKKQKYTALPVNAHARMLYLRLPCYHRLPRNLGIC